MRSPHFKEMENRFIRYVLAILHRMYNYSLLFPKYLKTYLHLLSSNQLFSLNFPEIKSLKGNKQLACFYFKNEVETHIS